MSRAVIVCAAFFLAAAGLVGMRWFSGGADEPWPTDEYRYVGRDRDGRRRVAERDPSGGVAGRDSRGSGGAAAARESDADNRFGRSATARRSGTSERRGSRSGSAGMVASGSRRAKSGGWRAEGRRSETSRRSSGDGSLSNRPSASEKLTTERNGARADRLTALRSRGRKPADGGGLGDAGEVVADLAGEAEKDGTLFDPFAPEVLTDKVDRGRGEDPFNVQNVDFLEEEGGVEVGDDSQLKYPALGNINPVQGSVDFVIEPDWNGADRTSHSLFVVGETNQWNNRMRIVKENDYIRFMSFDNSGVERNLRYKIGDWVAGERHQVRASWDTDQLVLEIDGQVVDQRPNGGELILGDASQIEVGSHYTDAYTGTPGKIFDLIIK